MRTLLVPLDGSPLSEQALPCARWASATLGARIHLLHVVPPPYDDSLFQIGGKSARAVSPSPEAFRAVCAQVADDYLQSIALDLRSQGFDVITSVVGGEPAEVIAVMAEQFKPRCVVMATHGYSGMKRWQVGSVADRVVQTIDPPALLVRAPSAASVRRILVPLDGSRFGRAALDEAIEIAQASKAELTLLHVLDPLVDKLTAFAPGVGVPLQIDSLMALLRDRAEADLRAAMEHCAARQVFATTALEVGSAAEVIAAVGQTYHADLIVMATHGYGGIRRLALGSVADKVLHLATTPLMLIKGTTERARDPNVNEPHVALGGV